MPFILFISFVVFQRLLELVVARGNEKWARAQGAVEYGKEHYPVIVLLHTSFLIAMIAEYYLSPVTYLFNPTFLFVFLGLICLKIWVIASLGKYWNTKILRIPNVQLVNKGPYKYVKHPNYLIVIAEIAIIPLVFHLYYTAMVFSLLNAAMLFVRIRVENRALKG